MRFFTGLQTEVSFPDGSKRTLLIIEAESQQEYIDIAPNIIDGRVYCSAKRSKAGGLVCFEAC